MRYFIDLIGKFIGLLYTIGAPLCIIFIFFGAYKILFAGGDPERTAQGWRTIISAIIGYGLLLILPGMPELIRSYLGQ